jgi:hypothetical protein
MAKKIPSAARFFYFHIDNSEEIKKVWLELAKRAGIKTREEDMGPLFEGSYKVHELTNIKTFKGSSASLSISLYKKIVIISGLFYIGGSNVKVLDKISFNDISGLEVAIGGAIVLITGEKDTEALEPELGKRFTKIETRIGVLCQFEEKEGRKEHVYVLTSSPSYDELEHFFTLDFPLFDFAIHKLHMERDYFQNQQKWILNEKAEIDKSLGEILHKRIVGETLDPKFIGMLEKDIDALSSKYGILVNDGHLVRKARTSLKEDIGLVYSHLTEFAKVPAEGLDILKRSIELEKKLEEAETSISFAIKNTKTAIDTVRTHVDLIRSRENIFLQEEAISFQIAAGFLEFIIIFYYSLTSWLHLLGEGRFEIIPVSTRFLLIFIFTSLAVLLTHFVGVSYKNKWKLNKGMILSATSLLGVFVYIVYLSMKTGGLHAP